MKFTWVIVLMMGLHFAESRPVQIIIIRHGEEPSGSSDHLSAKGQRRAAALAIYFTEDPIAARHGPPVALFAARPNPGGSQRSVETLLPTAERLGQPVRTPFTDEQYSALAKKIRSNLSFNGETVVIAWTHEHINQLAAALGVRPTPRNWRKKDFDRAWIITYPNGKAKLKDVPQRLLPGDSEE